MKKKVKIFPCWVCRGQGTWVEPVTDWGEGPTESCNYCDGQGLIEIGGKIHRRITAEAIAMKIIHFRKPKQEEWSMQELEQLGNKALNLLKP